MISFCSGDMHTITAGVAARCIPVPLGRCVARCILAPAGGLDSLEKFDDQLCQIHCKDYLSGYSGEPF